MSPGTILDLRQIAKPLIEQVGVSESACWRQFRTHVRIASEKRGCRK
jgi:hypothetical protein